MAGYWEYLVEEGVYVYLPEESEEAISTDETQPSPSGKDLEIQEMVEREYRAKEFIIEARGVTTIPTPWLRAGKSLEVKNVGTVFSGKYMVDSVENKISKQDGYSQRFNCVRNAIGITDEQFKPSQGDNITRTERPLAE